MIRRSLTLLVVILLIAALYFLAMKAKWLPSPAGLFREAPVVIDNTPILIKEIRQISQLVSITAFDEVVVSSIKPSPGGSARSIIQLVAPGNGLSFDRLVLVVKGNVQIGTDLSTLSAEQIFSRGDSVSIKIPPAKVLEVITNPSGTETFIEEGSWSPAEITSLKLKATAQIKDRALEKGLVHKADIQALQVLHNFLKALGYKKVSVVTSS